MDDMKISEMEKDALGEIMNISMGSAATAASELLNAKVWITTPQVEVCKLKDVQIERLEPAICVKIEYIKGLTGSNLMVLRQDDVQLILDQLMGMPLVVSKDFEFDELNISAVSEVMNQMMGASATALSDFLGVSIDISTPTPYILDKTSLSEVQEFNSDDEVVAINFDLTIDGVIKSEFKSIMSVELAKYIAGKMLGEKLGNTADAAPQPAPAAPQPAPAQQPVQTPPPVQQQAPPMQQPMMQPGMMPGQGMMPNPAMGYGYPSQYGYGYPPQYGYAQPQPMNVQNVQLGSFDPPEINLTGEQKDNLQLLMGVPLEITVEIGSAKRKVKDILEFTQGTIIELERQAGAPVDVVVNGNLIAKGDVVVIDDNFAVRITEIIKSKFMDSLNKE